WCQCLWTIVHHFVPIRIDGGRLPGFDVLKDQPRGWRAVTANPKPFSGPFNMRNVSQEQYVINSSLEPAEGCGSKATSQPLSAVIADVRRPPALARTRT